MSDGLSHVDNQASAIAPLSLHPQQVSRISQRFVALHQARLLRLLEALSPKAQKLVIHLPALWSQFGSNAHFSAKGEISAQGLNDEDAPFSHFSSASKTAGFHRPHHTCQIAQDVLKKTIFSQKAALNFTGWPQALHKTYESFYNDVFEEESPSDDENHGSATLYSIPLAEPGPSPWLCGLWLSSDTGTLKQPENDETTPLITVYLVTERTLTSLEQALWQQNAETIEHWGRRLGLSIKHHCLYSSAIATSASSSTGSFPTECPRAFSFNSTLADTPSNGNLSQMHECLFNLGPSQGHVFALDHFYATAIWLAGKTPLWWFIPPQYESTYDAISTSAEKQLQLMQVNTVDLGNAQAFTAVELLETMSFYLECSFRYPWDALFQLGLLETYTQNQEGVVETLSFTLKKRLYQDNDLEPLSEYEWDAHWLWQQCLEKYWKPKGQTRYLDWLRKRWHNWLQGGYPTEEASPHFGIHYSSNQSIDNKRENLPHPAASLPAKALMGLQGFWMGYYQRWQWATDDESILIQTPNVGLTRWVHEREILSHAFLKSYRRISDNLFKHLPTNAPEVAQWQRLGRKLLATYEVRPGKINPLNIPSQNREDARYLHLKLKKEDGATPMWSVFAAQSPDQKPLPTTLWFQSPHLHELLCWCYFNQLLNPSLRWRVESHTQHPITPHILQLWLQQLRSHLPLPLLKVRTEAFDHPAQILDLIIMIDLESHSRDALTSIDVTTVNSWNEVLTRAFYPHSDQSPLSQFMVWLAETLRNHLAAQALLPKKATPRIHVLSTQFSRSPWQRLIEYFTQTLCKNTGLFSIDFSSPRFLWQDEKGYQLLYTKGKNQPFHHQGFADQSLVLNGLQQTSFSQGQLHWLETPEWLSYLNQYHHGVTRSAAKPELSPSAKREFALRCVLSRGASQGIQILFQVTHAHSARLFCWDHLHGFFVDQVHFRTTQSLVRSLHVFIRSIIDRLDLPDQSTQWGFGRYPIDCWEINNNDMTLCEEPFELADLYAFRVQAVLMSNNLKQPEWRFYCDQQPMGFTSDLKNQLVSVSQFILSRRQNAATYPCYITDLDLSILPTEARSLREHLRHKLMLEAQLNQVIQEVSRMD